MNVSRFKISVMGRGTNKWRLEENLLEIVFPTLEKLFHV